MSRIDKFLEDLKEPDTESYNQLNTDSVPVSAPVSKLKYVNSYAKWLS